MESVRLDCFSNYFSGDPLPGGAVRRTLGRRRRRVHFSPDHGHGPGTLCFHPLFPIFGEAGSQEERSLQVLPPACWHFSIPPPPCSWENYLPGFYILNHFRNRRDWLLLALMLGGYLLMALFPLTFMEQQAPASAAAMDFAGLRQVIQVISKIPTNWGHFPGDPTERRVWLFLGRRLFWG